MILWLLIRKIEVYHINGYFKSKPVRNSNILKLSPPKEIHQLKFSNCIFLLIKHGQHKGSKNQIAYIYLLIFFSYTLNNFSCFQNSEGIEQVINFQEISKKYMF